MARCRRHSSARASAVLCWVVASTSGATLALADDAGVVVDAQAELCPSPEGVWSTIAQLVPNEAAQLNAAKGRVDIVDLGDRYRVHVMTDEGALERTYSDRARDCEQRTRFAAEFIVLALLPPQMLLATPPLASDGGPPPLPSGPPAPSTQAPGADAPPSVVPPVREPPPLSPSAPLEPAHPRKPRASARVVRIEATAVGQFSLPVLDAAPITMWGGEVRVRVGSGAIAGVAAIGYMPTTEFVEGGVRASVSRVPAVLGIRLRSEIRAVDVSGDVGVTTVVERYEGLSPHVPADATLLMPGLEVGASVSPRTPAGVSALASVRVSWLPAAQDLVAVPTGVLGKTPTFWMGAAVGISLDL